MVELTFIQPRYLWLLLLVPFLILTHFYGLKYSRKKAMKFSNFEALARVTGGGTLSLNLPILLLRFFTLFFLIVSISAPIFWYEGRGGTANFVIAIDNSGSMLANDFSPSRLEAAKSAAISFLDSAPADSKIAVMTFSGNSEVKLSLNEDRDLLKQAVNGIKVEYASGTAIGDAVITGSNLLLPESASRVIIILTDGQSNVGRVLAESINYANDNHVTVNTVGVATSEGGQLAGVGVTSTLDRDSLLLISRNTGGSFYMAQNNQELVSAYQDIARTSTKKIPIQLGFWLMVLCLIALSIEWVIVNTKFRSIP